MAVGSDVGGGIGGAIGGIIALATQKGLPRELREIISLWRNLQRPDFDMSQLTAPQLSVVAEVAPQFYDAFIQGEVAVPEDQPGIRGAQVRALDQLERVRQEGLPLSERLAAEDQQRALATEAMRTQGSILRQLAERGRAGGGTELALRMAGAQQSSELARGMGSDLAQQAAQNRIQAAYGVGELGRGIRAQDIALSEAKAQHINRFNEMVSQLRTRAAMDAAAARERAQAYNVGTRQRIADTNPFARYETSLANLTRRNQLRQQAFGNEVTRLGGLSGALQEKANAEIAREMARQQNITAIGQGVGSAAGGAFDLGLF